MSIDNRILQNMIYRGLEALERATNTRDKFAMIALPKCIDPDHFGTPDQIAEQAYDYADAMMRARAKKRPTNNGEKSDG